MPVRAIAIATIVVATLALNGCGEDRDAAGGTLRTTPKPVGGPATTSAEAIEVSLTDYRLLPVNQRVQRPGTIVFAATNDGQTRHALRVDGPAGDVSSAALRPGERATIAVRLPRGTYKWYCPISDHERRGMTGRVRVAE